METNLNNLISGRPVNSERPSGYQSDSIREVRARANTTEQKQSEQEARSLRRLNSALNHGEPLRDDVPRGYYLNITA